MNTACFMWHPRVWFSSAEVPAGYVLWCRCAAEIRVLNDEYTRQCTWRCTLIDEITHQWQRRCWDKTGEGEREKGRENGEGQWEGGRTQEESGYHANKDNAWQKDKRTNRWYLAEKTKIKGSCTALVKISWRRKTIQGRVEQGIMSHSTHYTLFQRRYFYRSDDVDCNISSNRLSYTSFQRRYFYRSDNPTNSLKPLKESGQSSRQISISSGSLHHVTVIQHDARQRKHICRRLRHI